MERVGGIDSVVMYKACMGLLWEDVQTLCSIHNNRLFDLNYVTYAISSNFRKKPRSEERTPQIAELRSIQDALSTDIENVITVIKNQDSAVTQIRETVAKTTLQQHKLTKKRVIELSS